ncbi:hypothetical protein [Methanococcoides burtonii]|uniref:Uncharacterized protein n=1 Tax=Methanococcoides burtonii (strain DSM 6242 / NBRC 107633 / OCM 468 / ACE-M) TaxID=259564 RepID=Q12YY3_METBU|nr:hypothetical protein [Methanococcoides burtonii]ABE51343.1 Hypothetical protein Mbur_0348 [Methanococcoides burtonii DSM 6242]
MGDAEGFDQSMIDTLMTSAEGDTVESKVADLEVELVEIKGSVKQLLLDIRETMSTIENPFQNVQALANITAPVTAQAPEPPVNTTPIVEPIVDTPTIEPPVNIPPVDAIPDACEVRSVSQNIPGFTDNNKANFAMGVNDYAQKANGISDLKLTDPLSLHKTIVWGKDMVKKYDSETMPELLDIFSLLGYLPENTKKILLKITNILYENNDLDESVMDLFRLSRILNPDDSSLDSMVLDYVLNEQNMEKTCQAKS